MWFKLNQSTFFIGFRIIAKAFQIIRTFHFQSFVNRLLRKYWQMFMRTKACFGRNANIDRHLFTWTNSINVVMETIYTHWRYFFKWMKWKKKSISTSTMWKRFNSLLLHQKTLNLDHRKAVKLHQKKKLAILKKPRIFIQHVLDNGAKHRFAM